MAVILCASTRLESCASESRGLDLDEGRDPETREAVDESSLSVPEEEVRDGEDGVEDS